MTHRSIPVFFVYRRSSTYLGSTQMRGFQLCSILNTHGNGRFAYHMKPIPNLRADMFRRLWAARQPRGAVYVFVKDAVARLNQASLEALQEKAAAVCLDHIDRSIDALPEVGIDLHIASSIAQERALRARVDQAAQVGLLLHQADTRLDFAQQSLPTDRLRPAYFGNPINAFMPPSVAEKVAMIDVGLSDGMKSQIEHFAKTNLHYAVRPQEQAEDPAVFKPLTKAVTAAVCGAPVLINRSAHDAVDLLGDDYPYLVSETNTHTILEMLLQAEQDFGGPDWRTALDRMDELAARVAPKRIAQTFETILETVL